MMMVQVVPVRRAISPRIRTLCRVDIRRRQRIRTLRRWCRRGPGTGDRDACRLLRLGQRRCNRQRTIRLNRDSCIARKTEQNLADDGVGLFAARVIAGNHDPVGVTGSNGSHQGALGSVTVAAAAEQTPQLAATLFGQGAQRHQRLGQCIGRVGVIDCDQWLSGPTQALHAPRHRT